MQFCWIYAGESFSTQSLFNSKYLPRPLVVVLYVSSSSVIPLPLSALSKYNRSVSALERCILYRVRSFLALLFSLFFYFFLSMLHSLSIIKLLPELVCESKFVTLFFHCLYQCTSFEGCFSTFSTSNSMLILSLNSFYYD